MEEKLKKLQKYYGEDFRTIYEKACNKLDPIRCAAVYTHLANACEGILYSSLKSSEGTTSFSKQINNDQKNDLGHGSKVSNYLTTAYTKLDKFSLGQLVVDAKKLFDSFDNFNTESIEFIPALAEEIYVILDHEVGVNKEAIDSLLTDQESVERYVQCHNDLCLSHHLKQSDQFRRGSVRSDKETFFAIRNMDVLRSFSEDEEKVYAAVLYLSKEQPRFDRSDLQNITGLSSNRITKAIMSLNEKRFVRKGLHQNYSSTKILDDLMTFREAENFFFPKEDTLMEELETQEEIRKESQREQFLPEAEELVVDLWGESCKPAAFMYASEFGVEALKALKRGVSIHIYFDADSENSPRVSGYGVWDEAPKPAKIENKISVKGDRTSFSSAMAEVINLSRRS